MGQAWKWAFVLGVVWPTGPGVGWPCFMMDADCTIEGPTSASMGQCWLSRLATWLARHAAQQTPAPCTPALFRRCRNLLWTCYGPRIIYAHNIAHTHCAPPALLRRCRRLAVDLLLDGVAPSTSTLTTVLMHAMPSCLVSQMPLTC